MLTKIPRYQYVASPGPGFFLGGGGPNLASPAYLGQLLISLKLH